MNHCVKPPHLISLTLPHAKQNHTLSFPIGGGVFRYEYSLKDHLGNSRVSFAANGTAIQLLQENHYYPFGMEMKGAWIAQSGTKNGYTYNGKELNEDWGLNWNDYGARWYDAAIGRFSTNDRFSEKYTNFSPYQYAANNPLLNIDVNGDSIFVYVMVQVNNPNGGTSSQNKQYYYRQGANGNYGFYDRGGNIYSGTDQFMAQTLAALNSVRQSGFAGQNLVTGLVNNVRNTEIANRRTNGADLVGGAYVLWNPTGTTSAPDQTGSTTRPPYIGLAHELAHVQDIWQGSINNNTWQTLTDANGNQSNVPNAEIYATHVENQIRAANNLPLRVSYGVDPGGTVNQATRILQGNTQNSLFYNRAGVTTFRQLGNNQQSFTYLTPLALGRLLSIRL